MKFREFLRKLSPTTGSFYQVRTDVDPYEVRYDDVYSPNIELRLIDQSNPALPEAINRNGVGEFIEPRLIRDEVRVYNSPNEAISIVGDGHEGLEYMSRYSEEVMESDTLRDLLDDEPIAFHGDQNSLLFTGVYKSSTSSKQFRKVALVLGIIALLVTIIITATVLVVRYEETEDASKSTANKSVVSNTVLLDRGQLDFLALLQMSWPLPDIHSYSSHQLPDASKEFPDDIDMKYYTTERPKDLKHDSLTSKVIASIASTTSKPSPVHLSIVNVKQEYVDTTIIQNSILHAKSVIKTRAGLVNQSLQLGFRMGLKFPSVVFQYFNKISDDNLPLAEMGFAMQETYRSVVKSLKLTKEEANQGMILLNGTIPQDWCSTVLTSEKKCKDTDVYRSLDGSCNNRIHKQELWGSSNLPYRRILFPEYEDGISVPKVSSVDGYPLPSAREISRQVNVDEYHEDYQASSMFPLWAKFIYNDLMFTPTSSDLGIDCCNGRELPIELLKSDCFSISISSDDSVYKSAGQESCMAFVRSAPYPICQLGPREQFNQVTSYLDASSIYGTTANTSMSLRVGEFGKLKTFHKINKHEGRALLPIIAKVNDTCNQHDGIHSGNFCFKAGDPRVNEVATLTCLHTLWVRHHNRVSNKLESQNPHWDDEKLFQESRRIIIAQIQHITYHEFLPELLGPELLAKTGLELTAKDYYQSYDATINPSISNVFGTAFRFGDSMVQGLVKMIDLKKKNEEFIQLQKLFMNSSYLWTEGGMDWILKGNTIQPASKVDIYVSNQLTEHYFQNRNSTSGLDLVAMDIQRGRDHGLPSYSEWRNKCGLSHINEFHELQEVWHEDAFRRIPKVYKSVKDIDLYTGMLAERHIPGGRVGPTIACIVADQFLRLRKGDRFWYEGDIHMKHFTPEQLKSIRSTTLARIICDNSDGISGMQLWPMIRPSPNNPIQSCLNIPQVNFGPWRERKVKDNKEASESSDSLEALEEITRTFNGTEDISTKTKGGGLTILNLSSKSTKG